MSNVLNMTESEIKARIDRLEHAIFCEQMSEKYNSSLINTYNTELKALRAELEKMGGRWSD